jgi:hypothetical protein
MALSRKSPLTRIVKCCLFVSSSNKTKQSMNIENEFNPGEGEQTMGLIGLDLMKHADEFGEPVRLPLTTQLFPYFFVAARKMSVREMSAWLEKTKGVKLSGAAIAKGLQRPELHLRRIAEFIQFHVIYLSTMYGKSCEDILFGKEPGGASTIITMGAHIDANTDPSVVAAILTTINVWAPIPDEVKRLCLKYFDFLQDSAAEDDSKESEV